MSLAFGAPFEYQELIVSFEQGLTCLHHGQKALLLTQPPLVSLEPGTNLCVARRSSKVMKAAEKDFSTWSSVARKNTGRRNCAFLQLAKLAIKIWVCVRKHSFAVPQFETKAVVLPIKKGSKPTSVDIFLDDGRNQLINLY